LTEIIVDWYNTIRNLNIDNYIKPKLDGRIILKRTITFEVDNEIYEEFNGIMKSLGTTEQETCEIALQMLISENETAKTMKMPGLNRTLKNILGENWKVLSIKDAEPVT
jgi:hypothetical protein